MIWTVLKALFVLIPFIVDAVKEGKIKNAAIDEVLAAMGGKFYARLEAATKARQEAQVDEDIDPNNRSR